MSIVSAKEEKNNLEEFFKDSFVCDAAVKYIILNKPQYKYLICKNIDEIIKNIKEIDLFLLKEALQKDINALPDNHKVISKINNYLNNNAKHEVYKITKRIYKYFYLDESLLVNEKELIRISEFIYLVIKDICQNEEVDISSVKIIGKGAQSVVLEIGNKVLKIGPDRVTPTFSNNPYIVVPLLRKQIFINSQISLFIEVTEKVDIKTNIELKDIYELCNKAYNNSKLKFLDISENNFGILTKDNIIHWKEPLYNDDKNLNLLPYRGNETLKKGEIVLLDADNIYDIKTYQKHR